MIGCKTISIEVPILFSLFASALIGSITSHLVIYRTCYVILEYNQSDCSLLGNDQSNSTQNLEKLVEPDAQVITVVQSTILSIFTITACICFGPWSDKFGRKPVLLMCQTAAILHTLLMAFFSAIESTSPWYFLIASIPQMFTGGIPTHMMVCLTYISDVTTEKTRGIRMAFLEASVIIGLFLGNMASSYLLHATNYESVFMVAALCNAASLIYTIFCIPESVENIATEEKIRAPTQPRT
ncbi:hypothetical protein JTB14_022503 [Gonioctena quinquepunctata]|nr:hypothetical protein JTB14_022503 [Gonioctena quinquepunctata]